LNRFAEPLRIGFVFKAHDDIVCVSDDYHRADRFVLPPLMGPQIASATRVGYDQRTL
jgi:hypothetical protein